MPPDLAGTTEPLLIWPENHETVEVFTACATQWRIAPTGGVTGLDYCAVEAVMRILGVVQKQRVFDGVRLMEGEVLAVLNAQQSSSQSSSVHSLSSGEARQA